MEIKRFYNRFSILEDDKSVIGEIYFVTNKDNNLIVSETFVNQNFRGQGIAKILVDMVVAHARLNKQLIIPRCSYVKKIFMTNPEYHDIWLKEDSE